MIKMRTWIAMLAVLVGGTAAGAVRVVDDTGNEVVLPRPAQRIVSLAPHATELLFAAGAGSAVVGVVAHSDWPAAARALPRVGDAGALDLERILALAPDLLVAWPYTASPQLASLQALKVPIFVSNPKTIGGIADDIERLGVLAGTRGIAQAAAGAMRSRQAQLQSRYRDATRLRVFYEVWNEPLYTIGGPHLISEAIALCGGDNVFGALTQIAPSVSLEAVLAAAPEVIIGGDDEGKQPAWLAQWRRWPDVPAVRAGNLYAADGNLLHRPGPRFVEGVAALCADLDRARAKSRR
jgi:iron complex transport system substrate-binding protein